MICRENHYNFYQYSAFVGLWANLVILAALGAVDPGSNPGSPTSVWPALPIFGVTSYGFSV